MNEYINVVTVSSTTFAKFKEIFIPLAYPLVEVPSTRKDTVIYGVDFGSFIVCPYNITFPKSWGKALKRVKRVQLNNTKTGEIK